MDLLSQRYANPYLILDDFIRLHQLHEFVFEILKTIADEMTEKVRWEFYLHKVWDKTFGEYVKSCEQPKVNKNSGMKYKEIGNVINESKKMLEGFMPE